LDDDSPTDEAPNKEEAATDEAPYDDEDEPTPLEKVYEYDIFIFVY